MVIFKMCDLIIHFVYFRPSNDALSARLNYCMWRESKSV